MGRTSEGGQGLRRELGACMTAPTIYGPMRSDRARLGRGIGAKRGSPKTAVPVWRVLPRPAHRRDVPVRPRAAPTAAVSRRPPARREVAQPVEARRARPLARDQAAAVEIPAQRVQVGRGLPPPTRDPLLLAWDEARQRYPNGSGACESIPGVSVPRLSVRIARRALFERLLAERGIVLVTSFTPEQAVQDRREELAEWSWDRAARRSA